MIKFAFERICFMKFAFNECNFFLASSHSWYCPLVSATLNTFSPVSRLCNGLSIASSSLDRITGKVVGDFTWSVWKTF